MGTLFKINIVIWKIANPQRAKLFNTFQVCMAENWWRMAALQNSLLQQQGGCK
jgi:hypothetical protein